MNDQDLTWLVGQIAATAELLGHEIKPNAAALLADDLSAYPRDVLAKALSRVRTEHTGKLTPKAVLDRIDEVMGRPAANEAWAIAVTALDERNTIVWTSEMQEAWGVARDLGARGDMVGARMAFISSYERLCRTAREERRTPAVTVSVGWDQELRAPAVERAVSLGYLSAEEASKHAPALAFSPVFNPVALLTGNVVPVKDAPPEVRERLAVLRKTLADSAANQREERTREAIRRAEDTEHRKQLAQQKVDAKNVLDDVRAGIKHSQETVNAALRVLGELAVAGGGA
jgi:uncharacterized protein (DUF4415 family)